MYVILCIRIFIFVYIRKSIYVPNCMFIYLYIKSYAHTLTVASDSLLLPFRLSFFYLYKDRYILSYIYIYDDINMSIYLYC